MDVFWAWLSTLEQWDELVADRCMYENTWPRLKATTMANRTGLPRLYVETVEIDESGVLVIHLKKSDVLVGLLPPYDSDVVKLCMGTTPLQKNACYYRTIDVSTGHPQLIMGDNCVPLGALMLSWAQVLIEAPPGTVLHVVHAMWPDKPRRHLAYGGWAVGQCVFASGMVAVCLDCNARAALPRWYLPRNAPPKLPRWHHWRERAAFHSRHHGRYIQELMAKACHPRRIEQILAEEDRLSLAAA